MYSSRRLSVFSHIVEDIDNESDNGDDDKGSNGNDVMKMFFIRLFLPCCWFVRR